MNKCFGLRRLQACLSNSSQALASIFSFCMGRPGFEPGTNRLKAEYSTVELATRLFVFRNFAIIALTSVVL